MNPGFSEGFDLKDTLTMFAVRRSLAGRPLQTSARRLVSTPSGSENPVAVEFQKKEVTPALPSEHILSAEAVSGAPGSLSYFIVLLALTVF